MKQLPYFFNGMWCGMVQNRERKTGTPAFARMLKIAELHFARGYGVASWMTRISRINTDGSFSKKTRGPIDSACKWNALRF